MKKCNRCGTDMDDNYRFCTNCGCLINEDIKQKNVTTNNGNKKVFMIISYILIIVIIIPIVVYNIGYYLGKKDRPEQSMCSSCQID